MASGSRPSRLRRLLRAVLGLLLAFAACIGAYLAAAFVLGRAAVNADWRPTPGGRAVYLDSNGVHVDLVLPALIDGRDLREDYPLEHPDRDAQWISFGWGDRGFFLDAAEWQNLTLGTALRATLLPTPTLMHVDYDRWAPLPDEDCVRVEVSEVELARLLAWVDAGFARDEAGRPIRIEGAGYRRSSGGPPDGAFADNAFFEARGSYHLFRTCNEWTRQGLEQAGIRAPIWSPFDEPILRQLRGID
jgi:uncharacterized protein (TIGR02117 family)